MRWTETLIPTLKETPAEAEIVSHQLLLRAGLIRKLAGGLYTFLPLGLRALRKVEKIIREEMQRAGAIEVLMPAMQPPEIWQQSGRYQTAQEVFFKVRDRSKKEWILGPTHEEVITTLVATELSSYRQLPKNFFQIQTKFRDEIRPRFGLMRAREFVMKDAYSFDVSDEAAQKSYQKMYDAYTRIFERCGLKAMAVDAATGVMGGKYSHEFMVPAETGENEVVFCEGCRYAANLEKAGSRVEPTISGSENPLEKFPTPGVATIDDLARPPFQIEASRQVKTLVYQVDGRPVLILLRGDHQLNEAKLTTALGSGNFRPATGDEVFSTLGAHPGSLGAIGKSGLPVYADEALKNGSGLVTGANENGFHFREVSVSRDLTVTQWADLRTVAAGERCPNCEGMLKIRRAIEVGHVFKLGVKYSEAMGALFLNEQGKRDPAVMGCYGIGVTRTLQAIIEQSNDKDGIVWPLSVAPYQVCLTPLSVTEGSPVMSEALRIYNELSREGVEVLLDDRDERPGVKFKDSELVGFPIRIGVGEKSLARGEVELKLRGGAMEAIRKEEIVGRVREILAAAVK